MAPWMRGRLPSDLDRPLDVGPIFNHDARTPNVPHYTAATAEFDELPGLDTPFHVSNQDDVLGFNVSFHLSSRSDGQRVLRKDHSTHYLPIHQQVVLAANFTFDANRSTHAGRGVRSRIDRKTRIIRNEFVA